MPRGGRKPGIKPGRKPEIKPGRKPEKKLCVVCGRDITGTSRAATLTCSYDCAERIGRKARDFVKNFL